MGFCPRNLSCSLPIDPQSPHACSTPGVYTFSVTWTVLRLLISLALGYSNRSNRKSPGSVATTRFLPGVLSFLYTLSLLERVLVQQATRSPALRGHNNQQGKLTQLSYRLNNGRMAHGHDLGIKTLHTSSISDRGYTQILKTNTVFSVQNLYKVFL
jgi:hypothetical protein